MPILLHNERFIILSQYEYFFQRIMAIKEAHRPGVALVGSPGIGKSSFLIFMLLKHLVNQEHVVLALRSKVYVFNSNGVFATRSGTDLAYLFDSPTYKDVLALVDSDEKVSEPDPGLVHSGLFAVHATSPQQARYKIWVNQRRDVTLVMDPLTIDDMHALVSLENPDCLREDVEAATLMYGSNSRTIADIFQDPNGDLLQEMKIAQSLDSLSLSQLEELIHKPHDGDKQTTHVLLQSASSNPPPQKGDRRYLATDTMAHSIASRYIWKRLYKFLGSSLQEIRRLFVSLAGMTLSSAMRGWLFEAWCHDRLCQAEAPFTLTEMVKISSRLLRWHSTCQLPLGPKKEFELYPSSTKFASTKDGDKYYVPQEGNDPTFDSFIRISDQLGIGFQMTIYPDHTLKVKGLELLSKRIDTEERMFVFVIPTGHTFECEAPSTRWMNKFKFYILEVDFGHPVLQKGVSLRLETPSDDWEADMSE